MLIYVVIAVITTVDICIGRKQNLQLLHFQFLCCVHTCTTLNRCFNRCYYYEKVYYVKGLFQALNYSGKVLFLKTKSSIRDVLTSRIIT